MARTWKDKPYRLLEREAVRRGYVRQRRDWLGGIRMVADVTAYCYACHRQAKTYDRWHDWRDYEDDWRPDYGNETRIRDGWRCRFNQLRSRRMKYDKDHNLIPSDMRSTGTRSNRLGNAARG